MARYIDPATYRQACEPPAPARGIGTVRYPRLVPKDDDCAKHLKKRTLTNLYNERPTWLDLAHQKLDAAVFAAYGWDPAMSDDDLLAAPARAQSAGQYGTETTGLKGRDTTAQANGLSVLAKQP